MHEAKELSRGVLVMDRGEIQPVTMVFANRFVNVVFDRLGRNMTLVSADAEHFSVTVPPAVSPPFFGWLFTLSKDGRIAAP